MRRLHPGGPRLGLRELLRHSLIFRQVVLFLCALAAFLVVLTAAGWLLLGSTMKMQRIQVMFAAEKIVRNLDSTFLVIDGNVESVANLVPLLSQDREEYRRAAREMVEKMHRDSPLVCGGSIAFTPEFAATAGVGMWYVGVDENDRFHVREVDDFDYHLEPWFVEAREPERSDYWCDPYTDPIAKVTMTTCSVPILLDGEFIGVVTADISVHDLSRLLTAPRSIEPNELERNVHTPEDDEEFADTYAFLVTRDGLIISHPNHQFMLHSIADVPELRPAGEELPEKLRTLLSDREGGFTHVSHSDRFAGKAYICCTPLLNADWTLVLVIPDALLYQHVVTGSTIALVLLVTLLVGLLVIRQTWRTLKPLNDLAETAYRIGQGEFDTPIPHSEATNEVGAVSLALLDMRRELGLYIEKIKASTARQQRLESEFKLAQEIQRWLLPAWRPPYSGNDCFELAAHLVAARSVGGDLYDFRLTDDNRLYVVIGDVSGKEISGALLMAVAQTLQLGYSSGGELEPGAILTRVNHDLNQNNELSMFVTMFMGCIDLASGRMRFCNAGQNPPYILRAGGNLERLADLHGPPLGAADYRYSDSEIRLAAGDTLVLYTDGVTEAQDCGFELYGESRFENVLARLPSGAAPGRRIDDIRGDIDSFTAGAEAADDITLLLFKLLRPAVSGESFHRQGNS